MSDDNIESERERHPSPTKSDESAENAAPEAIKPSRKALSNHSAGSLNKDLRQALHQALNSWDTLTEQMNHKMSPEEEQLREVKRLLGELKSKLSQFDD